MKIHIVGTTMYPQDNSVEIHSIQNKLVDAVTEAESIMWLFDNVVVQTWEQVGDGWVVSETRRFSAKG